MEQSNDTSNNDGRMGESRSGTRCPPMLLERDGDKSIYLMHGKKGEYDGVYAIWHGTTLTCYRSRDEAWNAWEKLKDDRTMRGD